MTGDGRAGAITACRYARNPVLARPQVMEGSAAVLLVDPGPRGTADWGLPSVPPEYFLTPAGSAAAQRARDRAGGPGTARWARWRSTPRGWPRRRRPAGW